MSTLPAVPPSVDDLRRLAAVPLLPLTPVRRRLRHELRRTLAGDGDAVEVPAAFTEPAGDPGLFGPDSMVWRVHRDLPAMLIGGITALFLQALHPLAMAGVDQHSAYRQDPMGRLRRTGDFIGTTTFASTDAAHRACAGVRAIHQRVRGTAPDGRPYSAGDPDLLRWVHVTEVGSFLRAYQRYSLTPLDGAGCDRYLDEVAVVAELLGATDVPRSAAEVRRYVRAVRPELDGGELAVGARDFLLAGPGGRPEQRAVYALLVQAAIGLLPGWGRELLGLRRPPVVGRLGDPLVVRPAALAVGEVLRWSAGPSPVLAAATARARAIGPVSP